MTQLLGHALRYAQLGWHVHPIVPRQKIPLTKHGVKDATTDTDQIKAWWEKWPDANIAVACGKKSGIYVVDVDIDEEKGIDGIKSLKEFPLLPETVKQLTPRGGFHAFYRTDNVPSNHNNFRPGIDIRGDGFYVVVSPSTHASGRRYRWSDGLAPWQIKPAEFPDFMRPASLAMPKSITFQGVPVSFNSTLSGLSDDELRQRASLYLAQCDPAIQGQAGHDKLLWAASAMVHGFLLSDDRALDLLIQEYSPRCEPPWNMDDPKDAKDFRRKVTEARKLVPKNGRGWLLNDPAYAPTEVMSTEEIRKLIANSQATPKDWDLISKALFENSRQMGSSGAITHCVEEAFGEIKASVALDSELDFLTSPTGLLGELCAWINATTMRRQPLLALGCALTFLGVLFGRKIRDELGSRTNLYTMGIVKSTAGKTQALGQIRRLCMAAGCTELLGGDDCASDTSIEGRMARYPATLFLWDEIGHLLALTKSRGNQHTSKVVPLLMKLYSAAEDIYLGKEYADEEDQRTIVQPCCGIYGVSTPERFARGITEEELQDGWLGRCLVCRAEKRPPKQYDFDKTKIPESLVEQVHKWFQRKIKPPEGSGDIANFVIGTTAPMLPAAPEQIIIPTDLKAKQLFVNFDHEAMSIGDKQPQFDCLWGRAEENARKIAVILAASESFDDPRITPAIASYACRLVRYLLIDFCNYIVPAITVNQIDAQKQKILAIIKEKGVAGCPKQFLSNRTSWTNKNERNALLDDLIEAGRIVKQNVENHMFLWTMADFLKWAKQQEK